MAGHGGKRPGAGRKPGLVSPAKQDLIQAAKEHAQQALDVLVEIAKDVTQPAAARVSAANGILDRGYGKAPQAVDVTTAGAALNMPSIVEFTAPQFDESDC